MYTYKKTLKLMKYKKTTSVCYTLTKEQSFAFSLYAQLFLDECCYKFNQEKLKSSINDALDMKDSKTFMKLSKDYNRLLEINT
ncbi:IDEAL domain-containing protein [Litchfieldia salsa]|uniref:IDEAL domain-containing protein n=1 Tax=Litchfieldia salsa TaxID=930152 RepID=A0A1H0RLZ2_9BACI|nr:IDEAL domain-containing protein [Litchfieldia salsa]SDP30531.1 IDEAL domain-containing protein [Litchfieldia salsa]